MKLSEESLPFGEALLITWTCPGCQKDSLAVAREDGQLFEFTL